MNKEILDLYTDYLIKFIWTNDSHRLIQADEWRNQS